MKSGLPVRTGRAAVCAGVWLAVSLAGWTAAAQPAGGEDIPLYSYFEGAVEHARSYADPYRNVTLRTRFTRPDGTRLDFWGFYDGGHTWRFRVYADQPGLWQYEAEMSDGSLRLRGRFRVSRTTDLPGMITVLRRNPVWFGFAGGRPFLVRGFHAGDRFFAANWPDPERKRFLDWIQSNGYNFLSIASHFLNRDEEGRGRGWDTPRLWPLNAAEYRRMERILAELSDRRIVVWGFAGFFGQKSNYPRNPADQELYVRYTLARLAPMWHLLWNVAGPEPNLGEGLRWMSDEDIERLGRLIASLDPWKHPISVHNRTGDDPFRDSDWTTYGVLQGPKTVDLDALSRGLLASHHPAKPLLAQETLWSRNTYHLRNLGRDYTDDEIRRNAWVIQMCAAGLVFADNDGNSSTGFSGTLNPADAHPTRHAILRRIWDFMASIPFEQMRPAQESVSTGYALAGSASLLVYLPEGGAVRLRGAWESRAPRASQALWVNARNPSDRRPAKPEVSGAFAAPDQQDWLLWLKQ
jgi:hypothetical protein